MSISAHSKAAADTPDAHVHGLINISAGRKPFLDNNVRDESWGSSHVRVYTLRWLIG